MEAIDINCSAKLSPPNILWNLLPKAKPPSLLFNENTRNSLGMIRDTVTLNHLRKREQPRKKRNDRTSCDLVDPPLSQRNHVYTWWADRFPWRCTRLRDDGCQYRTTPTRNFKLGYVEYDIEAIITFFIKNQVCFRIAPNKLVEF